MSNKMSLLPAWIVGSRLIFQSVKNPKLAAVARKQRFAGLREKCCGTRLGALPL